MGFIQWMESFFDGSRLQDHVNTVNPASGLPMIDNSNIDVGGNPYGTDNFTHQQMHTWEDHHHDSFNTNSHYDSGF